MRLLPALLADPASRRCATSSATATRSAACSWPSAWPTCSTSTRSTAPTGWPTGRRARRAALPARRRALPLPARPALAGAALARRQRQLPQPSALQSGRATIHAQFSSRRRAGRAAGRAPAAPRGAVRHVGAAVPDLAGGGGAVAPHPGAAGGAEPLPVLLGRHHRGPRAAARRAAASSRATASTWPRAARRTARAQPSAAGQLGAAGARLRAHARRIRQASQGERFDQLRVDLFSEGEGDTLLAQVQAAVRDLLPLPSTRTRRRRRRPLDRVPHRPQRPARSRGAARPAAVVVRAGPARCARATSWSWCPTSTPSRPPSTPCSTSTSAATRATFPFEIGDVKDRSVNPLLVALEWLLRLPQQRCRQSEVRDLLDVPALARASACGRRPADAGPLDRRRQRALGPGPARTAPAWAWARPANRMPGSSACGACCSAMPAAPAPASATSNRMPKWAGSMPRWPARWPAGRNPAGLARRAWRRRARRPNGASRRARCWRLLRRRDEGDRLTLAS
jgi:hypothetical protein